MGKSPDPDSRDGHKPDYKTSFDHKSQLFTKVIAIPGNIDNGKEPKISQKNLLFHRPRLRYCAANGR